MDALYRRRADHGDMYESEWTLKTLVALMMGFAANVVAMFLTYLVWLAGYVSSDTALRCLGTGTWLGIATGGGVVAVSAAILIRHWND